MSISSDCQRRLISCTKGYLYYYVLNSDSSHVFNSYRDSNSVNNITQILKLPLIGIDIIGKHDFSDA